MLFSALGCVVLFSMFHTSYAQTSGLSSQVTISDNLQNDPIAQDLLKKIEQTKKMIEQLQQKEFEQNQAKEHLEKMREESIKRLEQELDEWQRVWEKHSSRNAFESFVSKKPSYVQGVFWDQFEFKEQKVNAGRAAMNEVLINGGTMQDAKKAYNKAAATKKIELIEVNAQFNVKHNLADFAEQQIFNSTGQVTLSPAIKAKLADFYSDYKLQPSFMIANPGENGVSFLQTDSVVRCTDGQVKVSIVTSNRHACIDESLAEKWINSGADRIMIVDETSDGKMSLSNVPTNPATNCKEGFQVLYNIDDSEYQCVSESSAKTMIENNSAEKHTLEEYILNKDKKKIYNEKIYAINQEIVLAYDDYNLKKKQLGIQYDEILKNHSLNSKQEMQDFVAKYKSGNVSKDDVNKTIAEIRESEKKNKESILKQKSAALEKLESELKNKLLKIVKGYEYNHDINIDWQYLFEKPEITKVVMEEKSEPAKVQSIDDNIDKLVLENIGVVNSFGKEFDQIKTGHVLQITADVTNTGETEKDFAFVVQINNDSSMVIEPAKWVTGTLNSEQTLNVGLSWIPEEPGEFVASVLAGETLDDLFQVADIDITVNSQGNLSDGNYCKQDYELVFKYSDNSPICAKSDTASKLIKLGLAFD